MPRLSPELKDKIINYVKDGKSLSQIIKFTKIGKTTIYYYMRKIKGRKYSLIKLNLEDKEIIGEAIGIFAGDGYYAYDKKRWDRRIKIFFNKNENNVIKYYQKSFEKLAGKAPSIIVSGPINIMQMHSGEFCDFILSYVKFGQRKVATIELKDKKLLKEKSFVRGFLRGLIDSDGYVRKERKEIYYGSISNKLFTDFIKGLDLFGFKYKTYLQKGIYSDFNKVRICGNEVDNFIKIIKPAKAIH